jgi:uncharacterized protein (DUF362 family)
MAKNRSNSLAPAPPTPYPSRMTDDLLRWDMGPDLPLHDFIRSCLPDGSFQRILLKPNWVKQAESTDFPIEALVTSSEVIEAVLDECLKKYPNPEWIRVGDVPLQSCDFELLSAQVGLGRLRTKYGTRVEFLDLRRERWKLQGGFLELGDAIGGDPAGYREVVLDHQSLLEEVSHRASTFRVSDYDPQDTTSSHRCGIHRYLIAGSVLDADLVINLPKMKTHQKSGITGALKNLVGINGSKACLVHHQVGFPSAGGDEFPDGASRLFFWQARLREKFQKGSPFFFRAAKAIWEILKRLCRIQTIGTRNNLEGNFYLGSGSWHGNDSVWRMVYDLNRIIRFAPRKGGALSSEIQRTLISIMDGLWAGEGNGPLQPIPVHLGVLLASSNSFLIDLAISKMMGFDYRKIRLLSSQSRYPDPHWARVSPENFRVEKRGKIDTHGVQSLPVLHRFIPPPGWRGHVELTP